MLRRVIEFDSAWIATDVREDGLYQVMLSPDAPQRINEDYRTVAREECPVTRAIANYLGGAEIDDSGVTYASEILHGVTEFTRSIWRILPTIPRGTLISYGDIAAAAGCPRGARAAGNALNKNPFPVLALPQGSSLWRTDWRFWRWRLVEEISART